MTTEMTPEMDPSKVGAVPPPAEPSASGPAGGNAPEPSKPGDSTAPAPAPAVPVMNRFKKAAKGAAAVAGPRLTQSNSLKLAKKYIKKIMGSDEKGGDGSEIFTAMQVVVANEATVRKKCLVSLFRPIPDRDARDLVNLLAFCSQVQQISSLSKDQQLRLVRTMQPEEFTAHQDIFAAGDVGDKYYIIVEGRCDAIIMVPKKDSEDPDEKEELVVGHMNAKQGFGELALLHDAPRAATVRACCDVTCMVVGREDYQSIMAGGMGAMLEQKVDFLSKVPMFSRLSREQVTSISFSFKVARFPRGTVICKEGQLMEHLFVIAEGELAVKKKHQGGGKCARLAFNEQSKRVHVSGIAHGGCTLVTLCAPSLVGEIAASCPDRLHAITCTVLSSELECYMLTVKDLWDMVPLSARERMLEGARAMSDHLDARLADMSREIVPVDEPGAAEERVGGAKAGRPSLGSSHDLAARREQLQAGAPCSIGVDFGDLGFGSFGMLGGSKKAREGPVDAEGLKLRADPGIIIMPEGGDSSAPPSAPAVPSLQLGGIRVAHGGPSLVCPPGRAHTAVGARRSAAITSSPRVADTPQDGGVFGPAMGLQPLISKEPHPWVAGGAPTPPKTAPSGLSRRGGGSSGAATARTPDRRRDMDPLLAYRAPLTARAPLAHSFSAEARSAAPSLSPSVSRGSTGGGSPLYSEGGAADLRSSTDWGRGGGEGQAKRAAALARSKSFDYPGAGPKAGRGGGGHPPGGSSLGLSPLGGGHRGGGGGRGGGGEMRAGGGGAATARAGVSAHGLSSKSFDLAGLSARRGGALTDRAPHPPNGRPGRSADPPAYLSHGGGTGVPGGMVSSPHTPETHFPPVSRAHISSTAPHHLYTMSFDHATGAGSGLDGWGSPGMSPSRQAAAAATRSSLRRRTMDDEELWRCVPLRDGPPKTRPNKPFRPRWRDEVDLKVFVPTPTKEELRERRTRQQQYHTPRSHYPGTVLGGGLEEIDEGGGGEGGLVQIYTGRGGGGFGSPQKHRRKEAAEAAASGGRREIVRVMMRQENRLPHFQPNKTSAAV